jgi:hypothetical protein
MAHHNSYFLNSDETTTTPLLFLCTICKKAVNLESCKIDETGQPIHEGCYLAQLLYNPETEN